MVALVIEWVPGRQGLGLGSSVKQYSNGGMVNIEEGCPSLTELASFQLLPTCCFLRLNFFLPDSRIEKFHLSINKLLKLVLMSEL